MSDELQQPLSIRALWAILWRAVIWFPVGVARIGAVIAAFAIPLLLITWAVVHVLTHAWWKAAACVLGLAACVWVWRWMKRFARARCEAENLSRRGGWLF